MKIVKYDALEELLAAMYQTSVEELSQSQHGGLTEDGREIEFTFDEMCENIKVGGCYGFAKPNTDEKILRIGGEIHLWIDKENPPDFSTLLALVSHEVAHNAGTPCDDDMAEERRAEEFSAVAVGAYEICKGLLL